jgi:hypothetical protein
MNPEATIVRERVADPVNAGAFLYDDNDSPAVVEIPHGGATLLTRATAEGFDDERGFSGGMEAVECL